jgi:hypothetical protein
VPVEEPVGENPPDGAILDYLLGAPPSKPVVLEIRDAKGALVRRYASDDAPEPRVEPLVVTADWARGALVLPKAPGLHRWVWDLRYAAPPVKAYAYPISAIPGRTPREPEGPLVLPGAYAVSLTIDGTTFTRTLTVTMDPRVKASTADLAAQFAAARRLAEDLARLDEARAKGAADPDKAGALEEKILRLYGMVQESDDAPTPQLLAAADEAEKGFEGLAVKAEGGEKPRRRR